MQLAPNVARVETRTGGLLFVGREGDATLRRAAELTLRSGYTHFVLADASMSSGTQFGGFTPGLSSTSVSVVGNTAYGTTTYSPGVPIFRPTGQAGATVVMYRASDPEARNALEAAEVLRRVGAR